MKEQVEPNTWTTLGRKAAFMASLGGDKVELVSYNHYAQDRRVDWMFIVRPLTFKATTLRFSTPDSIGREFERTRSQAVWSMIEQIDRALARPPRQDFSQEEP